MTLDPRALEERWALAGAAPARSAFRTAAIDLVTPHGRVLVALDADDRRHLLVPIASRHSLKQDDADGRAVLLRRRVLIDDESYSTFADLELEDESLTELFTTLCGEVLDRIAAKPDRAVAAMREALADWRSLLAGQRRLLGASELVGVFGELLVLHHLLSRDPGAAVHWGGPNGATQDFQRGGDAVEVKSTTDADGRTIRVHGLDQLDVAAPGRLWLWWMRLRSDQGSSVPELVDNVLGLADDPASVLAALSSMGYDHSDREAYSVRRFELVEERAYLVDVGFPRITHPGLAGDALVGGLGHVEYSVDLNTDAADRARLGAMPTDEFLGAL